MSTGISAEGGSHDVRFVGGKLDTFYSVIGGAINGVNAPTNFEFGTLTDVLEVTKSPTTSGINGCGGGGSLPDQQGTYGSFKSTYFRLNVHDYQQVPLTSRDHFFDFSANAVDWSDDTHNSTDIVIEGSTIGPNAGMTAFIKGAFGKRMTVRNNVWTGCQNGAIYFSSHGPGTSNKYGWDGAEVYNNKFDFTTCGSGGTNAGAIGNEVGSHIHVYNNLIRVNASSGTGLYQIVCSSGKQPADNPGTTNLVTNNTAFLTGSSGGNLGVYYATGSCQPPTDNTVVNNLTVFDTPSASTGPGPWAKNSSSCNDWGTNAAQLHDNFDFAANGNQPLSQLGNACSATDLWIKGGPTSSDDGTAGSAGDFATAPGLAGDGTSWAGPLETDFVPVNTSAKVYQRGFGNAGDPLCPAVDYAGNAQTSPCTIGAFVPSGGAPPPTLNRGKLRGSGFSVTEVDDALLDLALCVDAPGSSSCRQ